MSTPLSLLRSHEGPGAALMLASFQKCHADLLRFDDLSVELTDNLKVAVGDFTHLASKRRYLIAIAEVPAP